jgi:thiosulfate reductase cytochrome b subunit
MNSSSTSKRAAPAHPAARRLVRRHALTVRITHWLNVLCFSLLLMSGLQIFNAHPRLYWGAYGADTDQAFIALGEGAFPSWITLPSYHDLAAGRQWHFFFAWLLVLNGLVYLAHAILRGHLVRDLLPSRDQLSPRHVWHEIVDHARLRFAKGEAARRYNALQKMSYLLVALVLLPLMVVTGLTMSPGIDAAFPWLPDLFGGRQSARTLHFLAAGSLVLFVAVHLVMVIVSGLWNNMRSMVTGRYAIDVTGEH